MIAGPVLVLGAGGQVGRALTDLAARCGLAVAGPARGDVDICDGAAVAAAIRTLGATAVVNAAAYTAVDRAESEEGEATRVNRDGAGAVARAAAQAGVPLIHISTDYVFDGTKRSPYLEDDPVAPLGAYGRSKEAGERAVRELASPHVILRTAWVYSPHRANFVKTMLRLGAERELLRVVDDQRGCPTAAADIATAVVAILDRAGRPGFDAWGTYHFVGADETTWCGFAQSIFEVARAYGQTVPRLEPIPTEAYPTPAKRPAYSVLSTRKVQQVFGITPPPLAESLGACIATLFDETDFERGPRLVP